MKHRLVVLFLVPLLASVLSACQSKPNPYKASALPESQSTTASYIDKSVDYTQYRVWRWADSPMSTNGVSLTELRRMTEQQLSQRGMPHAKGQQAADFKVHVSTSAERRSQPISVRSSNYSYPYQSWSGFYPRIYPSIGGYYRHGHWRPGVGIGMGLPFLYPGYGYGAYSHSRTTAQVRDTYVVNVHVVRISFIDAKTGQSIWHSEAEYPWHESQLTHTSEVKSALARALSTYPIH